VKYFAYGSNMLEDRLRDRAPSAVFVSVGMLRGYRLQFHKRGHDGSGKCNIERSPHRRDRVYGAIFSVDGTDVSRLDRAEDALRGGYSRDSIQVEVAGGIARVESYFANPRFIDGSLRPFDWYQAFVVAGALEHAIPAHYCRAVASVPASTDPDEKRREHALSTLGRFRADFASGRLTSQRI
jgi:hypothetical protein